MSRVTESVSFGGPIRSARVSLRIFGPNLDPDEVTQLMGRAPSLSYKAGDRTSARVATPRKKGMWILNSEADPKKDITEHVAAVLQAVPSEQELWRRLADRFSVDLYCVCEIDGPNSGFELPIDLVREIGSRHLSVQIDIYVVNDDSSDVTES